MPSGAFRSLPAPIRFCKSLSLPAAFCTNRPPLATAEEQPLPAERGWRLSRRAGVPRGTGPIAMYRVPATATAAAPGRPLHPLPRGGRGSCGHPLAPGQPPSAWQEKAIQLQPLGSYDGRSVAPSSARCPSPAIMLRDARPGHRVGTGHPPGPRLLPADTPKPRREGPRPGSLAEREPGPGWLFQVPRGPWGSPAAAGWAPPHALGDHWPGIPQIILRWRVSWR